jgi:hypothetical protein
MSQDPKSKRTLHVGKDGVLRIPKDMVSAEDLKPGDPVDAAGIRLRKGHIEESVSGNPLRLFIYTMVVGSIGALGGLLIDWPSPIVGFSIQAMGIYLTVFLLPLVIFFITWMVKRKRPRDFIILLLGLFYGGVLWLQVILEVFLRTSPDLGEQEKWDYLQGHAYDLFAVAAIVGAVSYFSADRNLIVRIGSLAPAFAVTGIITGFTEAEYLWEKGGHNDLPHYPYWLVPILWALTGIWYGLCVGFLAPQEVLAEVLRGEAGVEGNHRGALLDRTGEGDRNQRT